VGSGSVVNEVQNAYNDFGQLETQYQEHSGAVSTSTSVKVEYSYEDGSANTIRPTGITYPDGRTLTYSYGSPDSDSDQLSRVEALVDDDESVLASYTYLGLGSVVQVDYPEPDVRYDLITGSGANPYTGLDRFGRIVDLLWRDYGASADVDRFKYTYDRNSNRLSKENTVAAGGFDELYGNDALNRLLQFNRGDLNDTKKKVTEPTWLQSWNLDPTGNWSGYTNIEPAVPANNLVQQRTHNQANEIDPLGLVSTVGATWGMVTENRAGNMAAAPKPLSPTGELALGWDAWNRLMGYFEPFTSNVVLYQRDALNRKIVETVGGTARHCYYSSDWQNLEERLDSSTDPAIQNVWGLRYIDDLILRDRTVSDPLDERLYACQDALFSVTTLVEPDGDVAQRFAYTPYGVSQTLSPSFAPDTDSYAWTTRFTGRSLDLTLGLYDYRMRAYHTQLGRFLSRDPIGFSEDVNFYSYVGLQATNATDPLGLQANFDDHRDGRTRTINDSFRFGFRSGEIDPDPLDSLAQFSLSWTVNFEWNEICVEGRSTFSRHAGGLSLVSRPRAGLSLEGIRLGNRIARSYNVAIRVIDISGIYIGRRDGCESECIRYRIGVTSSSPDNDLMRDILRDDGTWTQPSKSLGIGENFAIAEAIICANGSLAYRRLHPIQRPGTDFEEAFRRQLNEPSPFSGIDLPLLVPSSPPVPTPFDDPLRELQRTPGPFDIVPPPNVPVPPQPSTRGQTLVPRRPSTRPRN